MGDSGIIDLLPFIRRKQQDACAHRRVEVSMTTRHLDCLDCGAPLDPWWYIRNMVMTHEEIIASHAAVERDLAAKVEEGNKILARMNDTVARLNAEISHLTDVKNSLANERVGDRLLWHVAAKTRRSPRKK